MAGTGQGGPSGRAPDDFTSRLDELRESGTAVLVVGGGSRAVHADMCRRLLGDDESAPRRRLLVFTNGTHDVASRVPGATGAADTRVITASATRSAAATANGGSQQPVVDLGDATLDELGVAIVEAVQAIELQHGPLEPTELRVGLDSIAPLLDAYGERDVFGFLVLAAAYVRRHDGLGHFHLPVDRGAYAVRLLSPLFDAVVEVRVRDGHTQQRWHLDDGDVSSRWLSL